MKTINLRDFYPFYTHDEFVEVSDEVAEELFADKRYHKSHERRLTRNKAFYSLDVEDGIEASAIIHTTDNPEAVYEIAERHCRLCRALNSLPEKQGKRIEAHYILGMSVQQIAGAEGVGERNIRKSISRGLEAMKLFLKKFE